jgi:hypothetical protein
LSVHALLAECVRRPSTAAKEAEAYAQTHGYRLTFSSEDIRAMALRPR